MARYTSTYDKDKDYSDLIDQAVANKDFESAAVYEQQRNAKIAGEGLDYGQTSDWEKYLPKTQQGQSMDDLSRFNQQATQWDAQINALMERLNNRQPFSYDPETDPAFQAYRDQYTYGGQQAMKDTLAEISARTGGLASSYAGQAAQGTYDDYMKRLSGVIPELRELAYNMYLNDRSDDFNLLGVMQNQQQQALQNAWNERGYQDQANATDRDLARKEIDAYLATGNPVSGLPADLIAKAGYSDAYLAAMEGQYAPKVTGGYGYGTGSGTGDGTGKKTGNIGSYEDAIDILNEYGIDKKPLTREQWELQRDFNPDSLAQGSYEEFLDAFVNEYIRGKSPVGTGGGNIDMKKVGSAQGEAIIWNGRTYRTTADGMNKLVSDLNAANLSDAEYDAVVAKLREFGAAVR